jgi:hypothetical protein
VSSPADPEFLAPQRSSTASRDDGAPTPPADAAGTADTAQPAESMGRIAVASFIGTAIEFYDFYIYGTAAALVLNGAFFPQLSPVNATLASSPPMPSPSWHAPSVR